MPIVTLSSIEKSFGQRVLFDKLDFLIDRGERVGLIGDNGSGKTTLFKIITGETHPENGNVAVAKTIKIGHLTQDAIFDEANSVMDEAELAFADLHRLSHDLRELEHVMADHLGDELDKTLEKYQTVLHDFELAGGYAWRHKLEATLLGVGLPEKSWEQNVKTLSGGQRSRLNLAKILIGEPDLLLLDEPTNHLDLMAIEWLEKYLLDFKGAVLLISHDRFLLDRLATRIVWLTKARLNDYPGNYSAFVEQKELAELTQARAYEEQQADIEKQKEFIRRFGAGQRSKEAKGREKRLNRLLESGDVIDAVTQTRKISLGLSTDQRAGDRVLEVRELGKSYGPINLWKDVGLEVKRGERIGIIGPNGSGKTTLLRALLGKEEPDTGKIRWGANLKLGYYDQRLDEFDPDRSIFDEVATGRVVKDKEVRDMLATMLFRGDDIYKHMGLLSGGERARVALAELLLDKPNVLILDEPTNHLDINSCEALENALTDFEGTILCVSHDRYFLQKIIGRLLIIEPPKVIDFDGTYPQWIEKLAKRQSDDRERASRQQQQSQRQKEKEKEKPKPIEQPKPAHNQFKKPRDNPYARPFGRLTMKELESQITQTEVALADCQQKFADAGVYKDLKKRGQVQDEHGALEKKLKGLEQEYFAREAEK